MGKGAVQSGDVKHLLTDDFRDMIKKYEGGDTQRDDQGNYKVYLDSKKIPTVGHGHMVLDSDKLKVGDTIPKEKAEELFNKDLLIAAKECMNNFREKWDAIPSDKQQVLIAMHFQMGTKRVKSFKKMRNAIDIQDWEEAAKQMRKSKWHREDSPKRAEDMAKIMEYEGNVAALNNNEGEVGGILLQIEKSSMDEFYGLNIDKVTQRINFIGKEMLKNSDSLADQPEDKDSMDEKQNDSDGSSDLGGFGSYSWYYFYTFLLMFYEKGDCDSISFSLDIDGKIDKTNQNEHHKLKKVYYPESHLRYEIHLRLILWLVLF